MNWLLYPGCALAGLALLFILIGAFKGKSTAWPFWVALLVGVALILAGLFVHGLGLNLIWIALILVVGIGLAIKVSSTAGKIIITAITVLIVLASLLLVGGAAIIKQHGSPSRVGANGAVMDDQVIADLKAQCARVKGTWDDSKTADQACSVVVNTTIVQSVKGYELHDYSKDPGVSPGNFGPTCNPKTCKADIEERVKHDVMLLSTLCGQFGIIPGDPGNLPAVQEEAKRKAFAAQLTADPLLRAKYADKVGALLDSIKNFKTEQLKGLYYTVGVDKSGNVFQTTIDMNPAVNFAMTGTDLNGKLQIVKGDCGGQRTSPTPIVGIPVKAVPPPGMVPTPRTTPSLPTTTMPPGGHSTPSCPQPDNSCKIPASGIAAQTSPAYVPPSNQGGSGSGGGAHTSVSASAPGRGPTGCGSSGSADCNGGSHASSTPTAQSSGGVTAPPAGGGESNSAPPTHIATTPPVPGG